MTLPLTINPGDTGHIGDHDEIDELLSRLDGQTDFLATGVFQGLAAGMPSAGASNLGLFRFVTDGDGLEYSDGSNWHGIPSTSTSSSFTAKQNFRKDVFFGSGLPWCDVHSDALANPAVGDGVAVDRDAFAQADAVVAALPTTGGLVYAGPGTYLWDGAVTFSNGVSLIGAGQTATIIRYTTAVAVSLLKWSQSGYFAVRGITVQATAVNTATKIIHFADCVYWDVENVAVGGISGSTGQNHTTGLLVEATMTFQVPERGYMRVANFLYVNEAPDVGNTVSRGIHLKGIVNQSIEHVAFEGWGNVEHAGTGMLFEYANHCRVMAGWHIKGNTDYGARFISTSSSNIWVGAKVSEDTAVGFNVGADCEDNVFYAPRFFTSTTAAMFQDSGVRTVIRDHSWTAAATSVPPQKVQSRVEMRKPDGGGPGLWLFRGASETEAQLFISDGTAASATAKTSMVAIERGSLSIDLQSWEINQVRKLRVSRDGYLAISNNVAPSAATLANGDVKVWFDSTAGAAKAMFVGRDAGGTVRTATVAMS